MLAIAFYLLSPINFQADLTKKTAVIIVILEHIFDKKSQHWKYALIGYMTWKCSFFCVIPNYIEKIMETFKIFEMQFLAYYFFLIKLPSEEDYENILHDSGRLASYF